MANAKAQAIRLIESICFPLGAAVTALHLTSFKSGKDSIWYETINEWGVAIGVLLIAVALVAPKWK